MKIRKLKKKKKIVAKGENRERRQCDKKVRGKSRGGKEGKWRGKGNGATRGGIQDALIIYTDAKY